MLLAVGLLAGCGDDKPEMPAGARTVTIDAPGGDVDGVEMGDGSVGVVLADGASTTKELWYPLMPVLDYEPAFACSARSYECRRW